MAVGLSSISLFSGAGGLDLGFEAAGFVPAACIDADPLARKTLMLNRPNWNILENGDVLRMSSSEILEASNLRPGEADIIIGGPPCQPFSKSAFWNNGETRRLKDPRADTIRALLNLVELALPRALVVENVSGIAYQHKDEALKLICRRLHHINDVSGTRYIVQTFRLNALDYGVPQRRERTFIVAFRNGDQLIRPPSTRGEATNETGLAPYATCWDAIGDIVIGTKEAKALALRGKWAALIPSIPEGENYLHHTPKGSGKPLFGWRTKYWSFLLKLAKNQPSWTLQAAPGPATGPFHWDNRLLSVREMCRLQTFPEGYVLAGDYADIRSQLGNAVPCAMAEAIGKSVRSQLAGDAPSSALCYETARRPNCPPPRPASEVPDRYSYLIGHHKKHPGTGKGPAAKLRGRAHDPFYLLATTRPFKWAA